MTSILDENTVNALAELNYNKMINFFFWCSFEKFSILLVLTVFAELNVLFFENYSIKMWRKGLKFLSIHRERVKNQIFAELKQ